MDQPPRLTPSEASQLDGISRLPPELLMCIGERLPSGRDAATFRSICSPWRDAVPFASFAPVLMLPFDPDLPNDDVAFYRVTDGEVFTKKLPAVRGKALCGSSHGWLALVNEEDAEMTLLNPFTSATVELPPADENITAESSNPASMVHGRWVIPSADNGGEHPVKLVSEMREAFFRDVVLSSPPDSGGCVAVATIEGSVMVAFCRVGVDSEWTLLDTNLMCCVRGIVHCQGRFLAISCEGKISILDIASAAAAPTATPLPSFPLPRHLLVRSYLQVNGELHLVGNVVRTYFKKRKVTYRTRVYKCDIFAAAAGMPPAWSRVGNNADLTIFVSNNFMASFGGASVPGLKRNCVCFSEPLYGRQDNPDHQLEITKFSNGRSKLLAYHPRIQGSEALCWIKGPNLWTQGAHANA